MIFADTSALYAALVLDDADHDAAARAHARVVRDREVLWTIDSILTELWWLLRRELTAHACDTRLQGLLEGGLRREPLLAADYERVWQIARQWPDQSFSLTDRQAFAAIERTQHLRAWSYDHDFAVIRLGPRRDRAITLLR